MSAVTGVYQSLDKLAEFLGFDTVQALQSWMGEKLCKPYWDEYTRGCAEVELFRGKKARLADCRSVLRHLAEGEAGGNRKFSSDFPDTPSWKFIDWQARLLYKIRSVNQADRHGIFFGKNMNEIEMATRAWQVILRLNLDASREQRPNKRVRATGEFDHWRTEDNEAIPTPVNPNGGAACVVWTDIPTEMEDNGKKTMITLTGLVRYTYEQFLEEIRNGLQLKECGYEIDELSVAGDPIASDTFEEFLKIAGGSKRKVVVDLTTKNCPVGLDIPTIENEEDTSRRLLFDIMVAEKVTSGFDLKNRFCKWSLIQEVTRSFPSRIKSEWELLTGGIDSRGDSIRWLHTSKDSDEFQGEAGDGLILCEPTKEDLQRYREQEKWIDNKDLQRQGHPEACRALGIPNPDIPRLPGMLVSAKFEFWQPLAIKAIKEFEEGYLRGGILADDVGIGKTFEAIGLEQYHWNLRKAALESNLEVAAPRPTLIVVPPNLIHQWASAIKAISSDLVVKIYYGGKRQTSADGIEYLTGILSKDSEIFSETEEAARTTIITSLRTLTSRHGPSVLKKVIRNEIMDKDESTRYASVMEAVKDRMKGMKSAPESWCHNLKGLFKRVIVDEAHEIRKKTIFSAVTLRWLEAPSVLLLTETPIWNDLSDILGLLYQLEPHEDPWSNESLEKLGVFDTDAWNATAGNLKSLMERFDPWDVKSDKPASCLRYTSESVKYHIIKADIPLVTKGKRMREVLKACMLKRSYGSLVDGQVVGKSLPAVQNISVNLAFTPEEQKIYEGIFGDCMAQAFKGRRGKNGKGADMGNDAIGALSASKFRRLCLVTTWTEFDHIASSYTAKKLKDRRKNGVLHAHTILKDVKNAKRQRPYHIENSPEGLADTQMDPLPSKDDTSEILRSHCHSSPKLRYLLQLVAELVILRKEKLLIFVTMPAQVLWLESVLQLLDLDAHSYRAGLNVQDRQILADTFHRSPDKCYILITSFWVCCTGLNLQGHCRNLVFWDSAPISVEQQALGRLKRVGATKTIRLFRLYVENTFSTVQNMKYINKAIPGLMAQLNMEVFGNNNDDGPVCLGDWVVHEGQLVRANDPSVAGLHLKILDGEQLLTCILMVLQGKAIQYEREILT
ncbi:hypothetical protein H109_04009 [Trichophyton interdigitale MR816]|uniref:Helicase ATP-binding domain-containing protein n=1 Tax=Trichophyton interdigitale (strain MR816) TaxID=1215338 RepID=A0A059J8D2_TRIIM|nr:hypothetical protein H101_00770 [Trichophyton interdigitale H6]KDB24064.1 hypothetical protein H109_04009 [Trichophyton interdigitale MR816]